MSPQAVCRSDDAGLMVPCAFGTERWASGAADSRSEGRAKAIGGRLQADVRPGVLPRAGDTFSEAISSVDRPLG